MDVSLDGNTTVLVALSALTFLEPFVEDPTCEQDFSIPFSRELINFAYLCKNAKVVFRIGGWLEQLTDESLKNLYQMFDPIAEHGAAAACIDAKCVALSGYTHENSQSKLSPRTLEQLIERMAIFVSIEVLVRSGMVTVDSPLTWDDQKQLRVRMTDQGIRSGLALSEEQIFGTSGASSRGFEASVLYRSQ